MSLFQRMGKSQEKNSALPLFYSEVRNSLFEFYRGRSGEVGRGLKDVTEPGTFIFRNASLFDYYYYHYHYRAFLSFAFSPKRTIVFTFVLLFFFCRKWFSGYFFKSPPHHHKCQMVAPLIFFIQKILYSRASPPIYLWCSSDREEDSIRAEQSIIFLTTFEAKV